MRLLLHLDEALADAFREHQRHHEFVDFTTDYVSNADDAIRKLTDTPYDAVVSQTGEMCRHGEWVLAYARRSRPEVMRIALTSNGDVNALIRVFSAAQRVTASSTNARMLRDIVANALSFKSIVGDETFRRVIGKVESVPQMPDTYAKLIATLYTDGVSATDVATVLSQDPGLCAKILQLANAPIFRGVHEIVDITQAIVLLGFETTKALVLSAEVFVTNTIGINNGTLSLVELQNHGMRVADLAMQIFQTLPAAQTKESAASAEAYTAGLLHDIGKIVVAHHMPEHFCHVIDSINKSPTPFHSVEQQLAGTTHADIGGYLLGLWGLPPTMVKAIVLHHSPDRLCDETPGVAAALYLANCLVREQHSADGVDNSIAAPLDEAVVEKLQLTNKLPSWRTMAGNSQ